MCLSPNLSFCKGKKEVSLPYCLSNPHIVELTPYFVDSTSETCLLDIMVMLVYIQNVQEQETV
jgi:hypothetical protein